MKRFAIFLSILLSSFGVLAMTASAATYYVATTGSDSAAGTSASPWKTIQYAADNVSAGDTVIVKNGTYKAVGTNPIVDFGNSGTASQWITFKAENPYGAILDGQNNLTKTAWFFEPNSSYIQVQGFEFKGMWGGAFHIENSNNIKITGNKIHDIGKQCTDTALGQVGMYMQSSSNITVEKNTIYNIGRFAPGENGCSPTNTNWQNHDHGIYVDGSTNVVIKNNLLYKIPRGWGIQMYSSTNLTTTSLTIVNNTFLDPNPNRNGQIVLYGKLSGTSLIANNIFYRPTSYAVQIQSGYTMTGVTVKNNITYGGTIGPSVNGVVITGNFDNVDPKLIDPSTYDARLLSGSPAIDTGITTVATEDYAGIARPQGTAFDIGAYEYINSVPAPTVTISASPASITSGQSSTLTWSSTNATSCTASDGWTGTKAVSGTQSVAPTVTTTYSISCTGTGGTSAVNSATVTVAISGGGSLSGTVTTASTAVNLTAIGTSDWAHWYGYDHKSSGGSTISNYTVVGSGTVRTYTNDLRTMSWSDGTPTVSASNKNGVYISGINNGFSFTAPADTTEKTLIVYVGGYSSGGKLTAHLSDGSVADYINTTPQSTSGQYDGNYTLTYKAASAGQTIKISWVQNSGTGNVTLNGAALASVGAPSDTEAPTIPGTPTASNITSSSLTLNWTASTDNVGVTGYRIFRGGVEIGTSATNTYNDTGLSPLTTYSYTVLANDAAGNQSAQSSSVNISTSAIGTLTAPPPVSSVLVTVSFTLPADGSSIYYTTNGIDPTQSSTLYSAPFTVQTGTSVKARSYKTGYNPSPVVDVLGSSTLPDATGITIGSVIKTTDYLNVRLSASLTSATLGTQAVNATGTVVGGPIIADGHTWWQIDYATGPDGWSVQDFMVKI